MTLNKLLNVQRKFDRMFPNLAGEQGLCRDYVSLDDKARLDSRDPPLPEIDLEKCKLIGTFVYDFEKRTETYIPAIDNQSNAQENYKK